MRRFARRLLPLVAAGFLSRHATPPAASSMDDQSRLLLDLP
jgi:hypothetical protein